MSTKTKYIELFEVNTDATAVTRGFYYQYLVTLKKWVDNFVKQKDSLVHCEVDDDIKEVGDELIFTQVKCYSRSFSLKSAEIKKTLFNFFIHFLKNNKKFQLKFCFYTNTRIAKNEKLLQAWIGDAELNSKTLAEQVIKKIRFILNSEIKNRKRKILEQKNICKNESQEIKNAANHLKSEVESLLVHNFVRCIEWKFSNDSPESAIELISNEVNSVLTNKIFRDKPVKILKSVLLSEIFKCSQLKDRNKRILSNGRIESLLNETDQNLNSYIDKRLIDLLNVKFEEIFEHIEAFTKTQDNFNFRLNALENSKCIPEDFVYPKRLTLIPPILNTKIYRRQKFLKKIKKTLTNKRCLCINGISGTGKSHLIKHYVSQNFNQYEHIAWINSSPSLAKSILYNKVLFQNLNLDFYNKEDSESKIDLLCNKLQQIDGNNLLVIDNYEDEKDTLKKIISINNWDIIILTKYKIPEISTYKIPRLDKISSAKIFSDYCSEKNNKVLLNDFFTYVDYNPLIIKLCAQTIENSLDITLGSLFDSIKEQNLDCEDIGIEIYDFEEDYPITLFSFLKRKFELKNLSEKEESYLLFLSVLPSDDVYVKDIALICGEAYFNTNVKSLTNLSNSLNSKGWLESNDGKIGMNKIVQDFVIYNQEKEQRSFFKISFFIIWLFGRIRDTFTSNSKLHYRFLRYAESILKTIKEEYRKEVYQPLLLLENELLNSYNLTGNYNELHQKWNNLIFRAENYLEAEDENLGIMYNNLGCSYIYEAEMESAITYLEKSIKILKKKEKDLINVLIDCMNNLTHAHLILKDLKSANHGLNGTNRLIRKYALKNTQVTAYYHFLSAMYSSKAENFVDAAKKYELLIKTHLKIKLDNRNDFYLTIYYYNLICTLFKSNQHDKVMENIEKLTEVFKEYKPIENEVDFIANRMVNSILEYYE